MKLMNQPSLFAESCRSNSSFFNNVRRITILLLFILLNLCVFSQSYIGHVTKKVNFREGPGKEFSITNALKPGSSVFIFSLDTFNGFYNVIDIESNKEGYIHRSFVKIDRAVEKNEEGMFTPERETTEYNPEIEIFNNTSLILTLRLNNEKYSFTPKEKRKLVLDPGTYDYIASAPGVIPNIGTEYMKSNVAYTWTFYIVTRRR